MPTDDNNLEADLLALLAQGRKIEAIKRYREATGMGLAEAKEAVEALERGRALPAEQGADCSFETQIVSLLQGGKKMEAVKLYRKKTGVGLKEARDFIEALSADRRIATAPRQSGCLGVVLFLLAAPLAATTLVGPRTDSPAAAARQADVQAAVPSKPFADLTR